jgi:chromosome segregation ATPase
MGAEDSNPIVIRRTIDRKLKTSAYRIGKKRATVSDIQQVLSMLNIQINNIWYDKYLRSIILL